MSQRRAQLGAYVMELFERIIFAVVDKALLGGLLVGLGYLLNKRFELFKSSQSLMNTLLSQRRRLEQQLDLGRHERRLAFVERQLSEFYWPLYLRLQKDDVMWKRVAKISDSTENTLPAEAGEIIEHNYVLPNHSQAVALIERHISLVDDDEVLAELLRYVKHVAVYQALRASESCKDINPEKLGEPYPAVLSGMIKKKLDALRMQHRELLQADIGSL